jgi:hypothetical protein
MINNQGISLTIMLDQKVLSGSWMGERDEKYLLIITISIYPLLRLYQQKIPFLLLPNEISLLSLIPSFSLLNVLTDFMAIIKYRKKGINNIL